MKKALFILLLTCSFYAHAAEQANPVIAVGPDSLRGSIGSDDCEIVNPQGPPAGGFVEWNEGAVYAILFDPTGSGAPGDPGCGAGSTFEDQVFRTSNIGFLFADGTAFGSPNGETGNGTTTYVVSIHPLADPNDPSAGPGPAIASTQQTLVMDASATYDVTVPLETIVEGPFFVAWTAVDFNPDLEVTSPLWDGVARPPGRQFVNNNDGNGFVDQTDFFVAGATGWALAAVEGSFIFLPESQPVPVNNYWALALMVMLLAGLGLVVIRRVL